jgi:hypothetical protein
MKNVIKKEFVRVQDAAPRMRHAEVGAHGASDASSACGRTSGAPGVRVIRTDGRVHALEVTCPCGEVAVIELAYEELS